MNLPGDHLSSRSASPPGQACPFHGRQRPGHSSMAEIIPCQKTCSTFCPGWQAIDSDLPRISWEFPGTASWSCFPGCRCLFDAPRFSPRGTSIIIKACHEIEPKTGIRFSHPAWIFVPGHPHRHDDRCHQLQQQCRIHPCLSPGGDGPDFYFPFLSIKIFDFNTVVIYS